MHKLFAVLTLSLFNMIIYQLLKYKWFVMILPIVFPTKTVQTSFSTFHVKVFGIIKEALKMLGQMS